MNGIFLNDYDPPLAGKWRRPKSKKEVKEFATNNPAQVQVEYTALFHEERVILTHHTGARTIDFVGPDPYTSRKFYGNIIIGADASIVVK